MTVKPHCEATAICFLAGGQARRMGGGDKALIDIGGQSILARQIAATSQHPVRFINSHGPKDRFSDYGLPVIPDYIDGFLGPLAGIVTGLEYLSQHHKEIDWMVSCATDIPFLPQTLAEALHMAVAQEQADMATARSAGRTHPVCSLWPVHLAAALRDALLGEDIRKIDRFTARYHVAYADFDVAPDPFMNVNRPEDIAAALLRIADDER